MVTTMKSILLLLLWTAIVINDGNNQCIAFTISPFVVYYTTTTVHRKTATYSIEQPLWMTTNEKDSSIEPMRQILCPDCDQCDGSGR
jgi:hypothetical protein